MKFSRRWLINFVLVVLIVLFTYIGNRFDVQTGYQAQNRVSQIDPAGITRLEIQTADEALRLERQAAGWSITTPIQWPANNINVERLLDILNSQTESRLPANEIDLGQLGLQFPRAMIRLDDTQILFGDTNNIGERRYTMIGKQVFLLPDIHLPFISQGLPGMVDRRLLPRRLLLNSLRLPDFELTRSASGSWQAPESADFPADRIEQLIDNWQGLEASRVARYNRAATPRQKLVARLEDGSSLEFFLMSIEPEIVIALPQIELQYHFGADYYYQLISLPGDENPA